MKKGLLLFPVFFAYSVAADDFKNCKVVEIISGGNVNAHIQLNCIVKNVPPCAVAPNYVAFDKTTEEGKSYLTMALAAFATDAVVTGTVNKTSCPAYQGNVPLLISLRMS